ncbi:MAG: large subunit ribosomal protein L13 [Candidatus Paceibacteria bacterium]|jgi:large subunit ribosomal protein L13
MTTETTTRSYTIDATGKRLGKVATEAASLLIGKNDPNFAKHIMADVNVIINNVSKLDVPDKKEGEIYQRYTGYPGGRRTETLIHLAERRGYEEVVRRTIGGMLPNNKHKKPLLAKLTITE